MEPISNTTKRYIQLTQFLLSSILFFVPLGTAQADMGPKPSMEFEFEREKDLPFEIIDGVQLECDHPDCSDAEPLEELGPQRFTCDANSCFSMAYGYSEYHRLRIQFSDGKTRESTVFKSDSFTMTYRVIVRENDLVVEKIRGLGNPLENFLIALIVGVFVGIPFGIAFLVLTVITIQRAGENKADYINSRNVFISLWVVMAVLYSLLSIVSWGITITAIVEILLALLYAIYRNRSKLVIVTTILLVNLFTLPFLWIGIWIGIDIYGILPLIAAEIIIWIVESGIFYLTQRKNIPYKEALVLTFVLNLASFLLGLLLPF